MVPTLVKLVKSPAREALVNAIWPEMKKVCVIPELLVIPVPLIVNVIAVPLPLTISKGLAPELKIIPFTSVSAETEMNL